MTFVIKHESCKNQTNTKNKIFQPNSINVHLLERPATDLFLAVNFVFDVSYLVPYVNRNFSQKKQKPNTWQNINKKCFFWISAKLNKEFFRVKHKIDNNREQN